jgi:proline iminopeptidase
VAHVSSFSRDRTLRARLLCVGDGQQLYWEAYGNPGGRPALYLHGGPGSGSTPSAARYFDPSVYRIILFDQRNCGRSLPNAADMETDLAENTTWRLVDDIENLRCHLEVTGWVLFGTSWGSTLALAYAQTHPARVSAIVLAGITMTRRSEIDWLTRGIAILFPEEWGRLIGELPDDLRQNGMIEGYRRLLNAPDRETRLKAARDWHDWEAAPILIANPAGFPRRWRDPDTFLPERGSSPTTSRRTAGLKRAYCCAMPTRWKRSRASWSKGGSTLRHR